MAISENAPGVGGNFLFARQAMLLVEIASRVSHPHPAVFRRFSSELQAREPGLFTRLPYVPRKGTKPCVPRVAPDGISAGELIGLLFDLVRTGHAHYGHQLVLELNDGHHMGVSLLGVRRGLTLPAVRPDGGRIIEHLSCFKQRNGDLVISLCPGTLYLDVRDASESAGVWDLDVDLSAWTRKADVSADDMEAALSDPSGPHLLVWQPAAAA
jgi:hypothetical protein